MGSDWQEFPNWSPSAIVLRETLDGGQSFRWNASDDIWTGTWSDSAVHLRLKSTRRGDAVEWRNATEPGHDRAASLRTYLACDLDWPSLTDALPWRSDAHLTQCIAAFPGLRILRQPFGETLLGFLCSATKQIVQIKQMCALLAERHGTKIGETHSSRTTQGFVASFYRLPSWSELADISEKSLRDCLLGFRARYIAATAQFLAARPGWLEETEHLPYPAAKARLMELPGVGEKVADCVLLFGAGKWEAFPVDTWVLKSLARRYGLDGWKPAQVAHFGRTHFGPLAGLAQQYLFAWERKYGGR